MPVVSGITLHPLPLARGPHTIVYRGWDRGHRCQVIVKVQRATDDPVAMSRFGREAAVMLRLRHPSIVTLYAFYPSGPKENDPAADSLVASGPAVLVMEYVPGLTLAALAADGWLPVARVVQIVEDIAAALDCIHALGIVHRDVKPANILLPKHGPARLTDFGVAHMDDDLPLTVMGDILGTIEYASPEQVHGNSAVDTRSDVYSLAAVAYFALTGTPPFRAADSSTQAQLSVMHRQVFSSPPPLRLHREDLPPAIEDAVLRGLAKTPDARYASAGQFAAALRAAVVASSGEPQQNALNASARRTGVMAGAAAAAVLLTGLGLWALRTGPRAAALKPPAAAAAWPITSQQAPPKQAPARLAAATVPARPIPARPAPAQVAVRSLPTTVAVKPALLAFVKPAPLAPAPKPRPPLLASVKPQAGKPLRMAAALAPRVAPPKGTLPVPTAKNGWYTVSGWIALAGQSPAQKAEFVRAAPLWIKVDGQPLPALASGQWAVLPAGKHLVTFQPSAGMGVGPKTWSINVAPSAHLSQQVPLPSAPLPDVPTHLRNP